MLTAPVGQFIKPHQMGFSRSHFKFFIYLFMYLFSPPLALFMPHRWLHWTKTGILTVQHFFHCILSREGNSGFLPPAPTAASQEVSLWGMDVPLRLQAQSPSPAQLTSQILDCCSNPQPPHCDRNAFHLFSVRRLSPFRPWIDGTEMADLISPVTSSPYYFLIYDEIMGSKWKGFVIS